MAVGEVSASSYILFGKNTLKILSNLLLLHGHHTEKHLHQFLPVIDIQVVILEQGRHRISGGNCLL